MILNLFPSVLCSTQGSLDADVVEWRVVDTRPSFEIFEAIRGYSGSCDRL